MKGIVIGMWLVTALVMVGCQSANQFDSTIGEEPIEVLAVGRTQVWADGELFDSVVTPATFKPESDPFDELYAGGIFKDGIELISESKPGDQDYNGGRWHLNVLKDGVDPDKYADVDSVKDLDPNDFESTDMYFECPLLPRRGRN
jgi:hypothetical protein